MTKSLDDAAREHIQDFAQQWFGQIVDDDKPWMTGRIMVIGQAAKLSGHALDSMIAVLIMEARKGDADADAVLCQLAADCIDEGRPMHPYLARYILLLLATRFHARPRQRGRSSHANIHRDRFTAVAVTLLKHLGYAPTRNRATQDVGGKMSGCAIVAEVLNKIGISTTERAIEEVWSKSKHFGESGDPWEIDEALLEKMTEFGEMLASRLKRG